jgi:hypothetical protein
MANATLAEARKFVKQYKRQAAETREHIKRLNMQPGSSNYDYYEAEAKRDEEYAKDWQNYIDGYHGGRK